MNKKEYKKLKEEVLSELEIKNLSYFKLIINDSLDNKEIGRFFDKNGKSNGKLKNNDCYYLNKHIYYSLFNKDKNIFTTKERKQFKNKSEIPLDGDLILKSRIVKKGNCVLGLLDFKRFINFVYGKETDELFVFTISKDIHCTDIINVIIKDADGCNDNKYIFKLENSSYLEFLKNLSMFFGIDGYMESDNYHFILLNSFAEDIDELKKNLLDDNIYSVYCEKNEVHFNYDSKNTLLSLFGSLNNEEIINEIEQMDFFEKIDSYYYKKKLKQ